MSDDKKQTTLNSKEEALLKKLTETEVDKDQVVSMVGNLVGMLGKMGGATGLSMPRTSAATAAPVKKEPQKNIKHVTDKLNEAAAERDLQILRNDEAFMQWLQRDSCKLKNFHEELDLARTTIELAVDIGDYDLGLLATIKAINIGNLHAKRDPDLLSELHWAQAEIYALADNMKEAMNSLKRCVAIVNPEATEESETYIELAKQLESTRARIENELKQNS